MVWYLAKVTLSSSRSPPDAGSDSSQVSYPSLVGAACEGLYSHKGLLPHVMRLRLAEFHNWYESLPLT
jgi:hypothetical protein